MIETIVPATGSNSAEGVLRAELASGDAMLETVGPVMRHLLVNEDASMFSDEIRARVRGILASLADEMLRAGRPGDAAADDAPEQTGRVAEELVAALADHSALLGHVHALALEWQLAERLQARLSLDPVVSPLLQEQIASRNPGTARLAMRVLAAQARHCQAMRRMSHALGELPGDLFHASLITFRVMMGPDPREDALAQGAESLIRSRYDEGGGRLGLVSRLVSGMGAGLLEALSVTHAGAALFVSALALAAGQDRDRAVFSTNEAQMARLALTLRSAGLKTAAIEEQFLALHPAFTLPEGFDRLGADRAAALLENAGRLGGD